MGLMRKKLEQFSHSQQHLQYLEVNTTKEKKDFYNENFKTLKKKIEYDTRKICHAHG